MIYIFDSHSPKDLYTQVGTEGSVVYMYSNANQVKSRKLVRHDCANLFFDVAKNLQCSEEPSVANFLLEKRLHQRDIQNCW